MKLLMGPPLLRPIPGTDRWRLAADWAFIWRGRQHVIERGFIYDGASIPWLARRWIGSKSDPSFMSAALLHDWMYATKCVSRKSADEAFLAALRLSQVGAVRRRLMYWAVRMGGHRAYHGSEPPRRDPADWLLRR